MSHERGQATVDYLALLAVLALLLVTGAGVAAASGGPGVANAVLGQLRRALCIVTGGDCPAQRRQPCVRASVRDMRHVAIFAVVVRVDGDRYVLREDLSDGTVRLTLAHRGGLGVEAVAGGGAQVGRQGRTIGTRRDVAAGGQGVVGYGEVFVAGDDREADEILRAITAGGPRLGRGGPTPRELFVEGGTRGLGRIGAGGLAAGAVLEGLGEQMLGARRDRRTGETTIALGAGGAGWALLGSVLAGPAAAYDRRVAFALTLDAHGRPVALALEAAGTVAAGASLPAGLAGPLAGGEPGATLNTIGRRWELSARLDLRDPDVAAAWAGFRRDPTSARAIRELGTRLRTQAQLDVRSYAVRSASDGAGAEVELGVKLGGEVDRTTERARLLAASTRPPGGLWERRRDCL